MKFIVVIMIIIVMKMHIDIKKEIGIQENSIDAKRQEKKMARPRQSVLV